MGKESYLVIITFTMGSSRMDTNKVLAENSTMKKLFLINTKDLIRLKKRFRFKNSSNGKGYSAGQDFGKANSRIMIDQIFTRQTDKLLN